MGIQWAHIFVDALGHPSWTASYLPAQAVDLSTGAGPPEKR